MRRTHGFEAILGLREQSGVLDGIGQLVGDDAQRVGILLSERRDMPALHRQHADQVAAQLQGQHDLRMRVSEVWRVELHRIVADIVPNAHATLRRTPAHEGVVANADLVAAPQQFLAGKARASAQDRELSKLVQEKYAGEGVVEALTDVLANGLQQFVQVENRGRSARDFRGQFQFARIAAQRTLERSAHTFLLVQ